MAKYPYIIKEPKYKIGDEWTVKPLDWLDANEPVIIRDLEKPGRHRKAYVVNQRTGRTGWISVKKLKKRISRI